MSNYNYEDGKINGKEEVELYYQAWLSPREKAILIIVHGLGEHCGRYSNLLDQLSGKGISVYGMDLRGHGKSGGRRGHVESFLDYVHDLKSFIELIKEKHDGVPIYMLGHSMGATIACRYALQYQEDLSGIITTAGAFIPKVEVPSFIQKTGLILSKIVPKLQKKNGIDPSKLSHDAEVVSLYKQDELVHDLVTVRWYTEFNKNVENCLGRGVEIRLPALILHGGSDEIADIKGSKLLFDKIMSTDKEMKVFEDLYHEIMNETGNKTQVLAVISKWMNDRITAVAKKLKTEKKPLQKKGSPSGSVPEKAVTKYSSKKAVKKVKKAAKKAAKKAVKKAVKKSAKKAVKKPATKKIAKKTVKKTAKKAVKKTSTKKAAKKTVKKTAKKK
ncbi:MAG: lysophospholipase [Spirochaetes bacterium]|jgi:acylglycerol lipase|nr:lysophospholipase [Spirochaetota bacterium]